MQCRAISQNLRGRGGGIMLSKKARDLVSHTAVHEERAGHRTLRRKKNTFEGENQKRWKGLLAEKGRCSVNASEKGRKSRDSEGQNNIVRKKKKFVVGEGSQERPAKMKTVCTGARGEGEKRRTLSELKKVRSQSEKKVPGTPREGRGVLAVEKHDRRPQGERQREEGSFATPMQKEIPCRIRA